MLGGLGALGVVAGVVGYFDIGVVAYCWAFLAFTLSRAVMRFWQIARPHRFPRNRASSSITMAFAIMWVFLSILPEHTVLGEVMSTYTATIRWSRKGDGDFAKGQYSRAHEWAFDGGAVVPASASPHIVPAPWSDAAGVDPEEAFVASLSSCHMLFFIDFARRDGWLIDSYVDEAQGVLESTTRKATKRWSASRSGRGSPGPARSTRRRTRSPTSTIARMKPASSPTQ